jgi:glucose/mannose-6-phosphate isomerase
MPSQMLDDVLALPDQLRDALWRVESARLEAVPSSGLLACGMGGSAIGGDLAAAALGDRLALPMATVRDYRLPGWATEESGVLCSSYSGDTEETLSCFEAATRLGAPRIVAATGGALVERAREEGVPVVGLPGILQPRAAVAYMFVVAAEAAALFGVAPRIAEEVEAAAEFLEQARDDARRRAAEVASGIEGTVPVFCGAGTTAPVARRCKTQVNENAKLPAFFSELPEADHNEICGWEGAAAKTSPLSVVMLEDPAGPDRVRRRFELTGDSISAAGTEVVRVEAQGGSAVERLLWTVMLGDLVSLSLAEARGVDPLAVDALDSLKQALARP